MQLSQSSINTAEMAEIAEMAEQPSAGIQSVPDRSLPFSKPLFLAYLK